MTASASLGSVVDFLEEIKQPNAKLCCTNTATLALCLTVAMILHNQNMIFIRIPLKGRKHLVDWCPQHS
jgi:hypothetical protein